MTKLAVCLLKLGLVLFLLYPNQKHKLSSQMDNLLVDFSLSAFRKLFRQAFCCLSSTKRPQNGHGMDREFTANTIVIRYTPWTLLRPCIILFLCEDFTTLSYLEGQSMASVYESNNSYTEQLSYHMRSKLIDLSRLDMAFFLVVLLHILCDNFCHYTSTNVC